MKNIIIFANIDRILMALVTFLIILGLVTLFSASQQNFTLVSNQIINILIGMFILLILSNLHPEQI